MNLPDFPFLREKHHVISLVGAGGKTTLMYALAEAYCRRRFRVLVTTTTHIWRPAGNCFAADFSGALRLWSQGRYAVAGTDAAQGKLGRLSEPELQVYLKEADIVLIEADGAKGMPCKLPLEYEPVLIKESDIVIGMAGLDGLGRPLQEVCFRLERTEQFLGKKRTELLTEEDLARILSSREGTGKNTDGRSYHVVLNKCTDGKRRQSAGRVTELLHGRGIAQVYVIYESSGPDARPQIFDSAF